MPKLKSNNYLILDRKLWKFLAVKEYWSLCLLQRGDKSKEKLYRSKLFLLLHYTVLTILICNDTEREEKVSKRTGFRRTETLFHGYL